MVDHLSPLLVPVAYPDSDFQISSETGKQMIWDSIRKKRVVLTPEEWVRQNFIQYLTTVLKYPASLMAIEKEIQLTALKKRCDIVVYKNAKPWMIVECKEPQVPINEKVLRQILTYNISLRVPYLILTNGPHTFAVRINDDRWEYLKVLPEWK